MSKAIPYIIQGDNIVLSVNNRGVTITTAHMRYNQIKQAIINLDWDSIPELLDTKTALVEFAEGQLEIRDNQLYWNDRPMNTALSKRLIAMYRDGFGLEPLTNFIKNLMENPSYRSVESCYAFLERNNLPITEDGHFLAYKWVDTDYMDCWTHTMDNSVGSIVEMDRNGVVDDPGQCCAAGLHFCSADYLGHYSGAHLMVLKINPRDVVSVPESYGFTKGRCCRYEVIDEIDQRIPEDAFPDVVDSRDKQVIASKLATTANKVQGDDGRWRDSSGRYCSPPAE